MLLKYYGCITLRERLKALAIKRGKPILILNTPVSVHGHPGLYICFYTRISDTHLFQGLFKDPSNAWDPTVDGPAQFKLDGAPVGDEKNAVETLMAQGNLAVEAENAAVGNQA